MWRMQKKRKCSNPRDVQSDHHQQQQQQVCKDYPSYPHTPCLSGHTRSGLTFYRTDWPRPRDVQPKHWRSCSRFLTSNPFYLSFYEGGCGICTWTNDVALSSRIWPESLHIFINIHMVWKWVVGYTPSFLFHLSSWTAWLQQVERVTQATIERIRSEASVEKVWQWGLCEWG